MNSYHLW